MILQATYTEVSAHKEMMDDLTKICTDMEINISIPGYKKFDPLKPDLAQTTEDLFPTVV